MTDPSTVVGLTASFTPQPLVRPLRAALESALESVLGDSATAEVLVADFNQVHQTLLDPASSFEKPLDRLLVLWRIEDVFSAAVTIWVIESGDASALVADVRQLGALVAQAAAAGVPVVATIPPVPEFSWLDPLDTRTSVRLTVLHGQLVAAFVDGIGQAPVTLVDLAALQRQHGSARAHDTRNDLMYHQPYTSEFAKVLGTLLGEALAQLGRPTPKVLAVDADNTLWGGIVGEDGADGILIGDSFPGNGFRALQQGLAYQAANGALLAMVSKNNEQDVEEVFDNRSGDMVLGRSSFAAKRVDWNSKADNIAAIAAELNLGIDSFVFIDDNDVELDEVRQRLSGVEVVKVTDEASEIAELTAGFKAFRFARVSQEDRERTAMMQIEADRKSAASGALSHEDFLRSLELTVRVFEPTEAHVGRVAQLINKTNQFNLTTIRRDEAEVAALVADGTHRVYAAEVSDRFGGYGLVAVAIVETGAERWDVDTFLMSCRVLRRGVEDAILACIAEDAAAVGATALRGRYVPSAKNVQVADFYTERGFSSSGEGQYDAVLPIAPAADHVTVLRDA
ncbi:HAD-IIIC family phosphatase [Nocardioides marmoriginsengisoli]|uniref:HAD-IIIC family phosphatase n=1 Tax=Nocardioides marmoriginsengisoli TaxID=661483 RepID=UPI0016089358|nr:HAD-IIIC family phosphatase [Nocardioides marmoriginsengisoli]